MFQGKEKIFMKNFFGFFFENSNVLKLTGTSRRCLAYGFQKGVTFKNFPKMWVKICIFSKAL